MSEGAMSKWSDRKTVAVATSIFLTGVVGSFGIAATWNVVLAVPCLFAGLGTAMILINNATDEPNRD